MNGLLAQNLTPTSWLLYTLVAGPAAGYLHYRARRLLRPLGRAITRLAVVALAAGAITLTWKTGLLHHANPTGPVHLNPNTYSDS